MNQTSEPAGTIQINDERAIFRVIVAASLFFAVGYGVLLFALTHQNHTPETASGSPTSGPLGPIPLDHPRRLTDFSLADRTGRTVTQSELAGKFLVVDFLFTSCSLTCPVVNRHMAEIQRLTADQPDVKLVSLTVDPRDDTPDVLAKYGERFGADTNRWLLLTGEKAQLYELIKISFLSQDLNDPFSYMPGNFSHTERIAVVDRHGNVRAYFDGLQAEAPAAVASEISRLRGEN